MTERLGMKWAAFRFEMPGRHAAYWRGEIVGRLHKAKTGWRYVSFRHKQWRMDPGEWQDAEIARPSLASAKTFGRLLWNRHYGDWNAAVAETRREMT